MADPKVVKAALHAYLKGEGLTQFVIDDAEYHAAPDYERMLRSMEDALTTWGVVAFYDNVVNRTELRKFALQIAMKPHEPRGTIPQLLENAAEIEAWVLRNGDQK